MNILLCSPAVTRTFMPRFRERVETLVARLTFRGIYFSPDDAATLVGFFVEKSPALVVARLRSISEFAEGRHVPRTPKEETA